MRIIILLFFCLALSPGALLAQNHPSVHGMVLFGSEKIYLSHLPLFHAPHDYQVLLEIDLPTSAKASYRAQLRRNPNGLFTIAPEKFVLEELVGSRREFSADLYVGHFERDGRIFQSAVRVEVKNVLHFRKLNPNDPRPEHPRFHWLKASGEEFIVHWITGRPSFEQILRVRSIGGVPSPTSLYQGLLRGFSCAPGQGIATGIEILFEHESTNQLVDVELLASLYLEYGDLSH